MKKVIATLESAAPYGQSRYYKVEKLEKESDKDYEARTWRNRLHVDEKGEVFIPPMAFKHCLAQAAKYLSRKIPGKGTQTYTKHFEAGVMCTDPVGLGIDVDAVPGLWLFVPANGTPGGGKCVMKCFPRIDHWRADVSFHVLDETITKAVFTEHLIEAGKFIGIGFFRPRNRGYWGRFEVVKVKWGAK